MSNPLEVLQAETARKLVLSLREELAEAKAALERIAGLVWNADRSEELRTQSSVFEAAAIASAALATHPGPESREQAEPAPSGSIPPAGPSVETVAAAVRCCRTCGKPGCSNPTHDQSPPLRR